MKKIPEPDTEAAVPLSPAEMNKIHFGGILTPLTPDQIRALAEGQPTKPQNPPPRRQKRV